jgi:hypothetical protein
MADYGCAAGTGLKKGHNKCSVITFANFPSISSD